MKVMTYGKELDSPACAKGLEGSQVNVMIEVRLINEMKAMQGHMSVYKSCEFE